MTLININDYTLEELANALFRKGIEMGYPKITDKSKWREPVMADKLGHIAHKNISAGANSEDYGSDATTPDGKKVEYKTCTIDDKDLRKLFGRIKYKKTGEVYAPLTVGGVYNGAYKQSALDAYAKIDHYFGVFYQEKCILIIKPKTTEVISQLTENNNKRKAGATTNGNTASFNLKNDTDKFEVVYRDDEWFVVMSSM
jgi:hypothetical protein